MHERGALRRHLDDIDWEQVIRETVPAKFVELNLKAYEAGRAAVG